MHHPRRWLLSVVGLMLLLAGGVPPAARRASATSAVPPPVFTTVAPTLPSARSVALTQERARLAFAPTSLAPIDQTPPRARPSNAPLADPPLPFEIRVEIVADEAHGYLFWFETPFGHVISAYTPSADGGEHASDFDDEYPCQPQTYSQHVTWSGPPPPGRYVTNLSAGGEACLTATYTVQFLVNGVVAKEYTDSVASGGGSFDKRYAFELQPSDQTGPPEQCPCQKTTAGDPIDTRTGNLWTTATDLTVRGTGPTLEWTRAYASQRTNLISDTLAPLGAGWQFAYGARVFTDPAEPDVVSILSPQGNRFRYTNHDGAFESYPGIFNTLALDDGVYTQTFRTHERHLYDEATGRLTDIYDPDGGHIVLTYDDGLLTTVADADNAQRFLTVTYSGTLMTQVADNVGRTVSYEYANDDTDLWRVHDVADRTTTYHYTNHILTGIDNPLGQPLERTEFDAYTPAGKAISQTLQDGRQLTLSYLDGATVITTTNGGLQQVDVNTFGPADTLTDTTLNGVTIHEAVTDGNFAPGVKVDGNGHASQTIYTERGQPLTITNTLGQITRFDYDERHNPITVTDTLGRQTAYGYDAFDNVITETVGITTAFPLGMTTRYTYSDTFVHEKVAERLPNGRVNTFALNDHGHVVTTTLGVNTPTPQVSVTAYDATDHDRVLQTTEGSGTAFASTTAFGYDAWARVVTTTFDLGTPAERRDITRYNADDTIAETIRNYQNGVSAAAHPDEDVITTYGYDGLGRRIWERDPLGHYAVTHYDDADRIDWTLRNLWPITFDDDELVIPETPPAYDPERLDANVATLTQVDGLGRTVLVTQTGILTGSITIDDGLPVFDDVTVRVTRTEYDLLNRPITVTENYRPAVNDGQFDTALPDVNLQTVTQYDLAGNATWLRDTVGRWTKREYDALNRPVTVTLNYENGNPLTVDLANESWTDGTDTDIVQVTRYTVDGQIDRTISNYVAPGAFAVTAPITNRIMLHEYDAIGRALTTTLNYTPTASPTRTDVNLVQRFAYDPQNGDLIGQSDPSGRWNHTDYDLFGRVTGTVANCRTSGVPTPTDCDAFDPGDRIDRNVPALMRYDALGREQERENQIGVVDRVDIDRDTRTTMTTQNYALGAPSTPVTNVISLATADALGRTVITTDTVVTGSVMAERVTTTGYDALGQPLVTENPLGTTTFEHNGLGYTIVVTDTAGRVTRAGYDGTGVLRWTKRHDGQITIYHVDGMGRVRTTIQNYQNGVFSGGEAIDRDIIMPTAYDAAGRTVLTTDALRRATALGYDLQNRLTTVTDHMVSGTCTGGPCNVLTGYRYDRAGNRIKIIDARSNVRRFSYDAANRQTTETDALTVVTGFSYDRLGRTTFKDDPRGSNYDVTFTYDEQDHITKTASIKLATIDITYTALGLRHQMHDASGWTTYAYDQLGRTTGVAQGSFVVGYAYTSRGDRTRLEYPNSTVVTHTYDLAARMTGVYADGTALAAYDYDAAGRLATLTRANGIETAYGYDAADQLTHLATTQISNSATIAIFAYELNPLGQATTVTETIPYVSGTPAVKHYTYDDLARLVQVQHGVTTTYTYTYDLVGNRLSAWENGASRSWTYDAADRDEALSYDAAGNMTDDGIQPYLYDALNRVEAISFEEGVRENYLYNGDGVMRRRLRTDTADHAIYVPDLAIPLSQVLETIDTSMSTITNSIYGLERVANTTASSRSWDIPDALGSIRLTLNDSGVPISAGEYDPWGQPLAGTVPAPFGFTGEVADPLTNLVYLRARWYQPTNGRFVNRDPFDGYPERPASLHRYQYGYNDPINNTDPSGLCPTFNSTCRQLLEDIKNQMGYPPKDLEIWTIPELQTLDKWMRQGVKFSFLPPNIDLCLHPDPTKLWTEGNLADIRDGLERIYQVVGPQTLPMLNLNAGLTFVKTPAGGGIGGETKQSLNNIFLYLTPSREEKAIELIVHELGHVTDWQARPSSATPWGWSAVSAEWAMASGWIRTHDHDTWTLPTGSLGRAGAVSEYALTGVGEDFAETFTWYIEDKAGGGYTHRNRNPDNQNNIPNTERTKAVTLAISLARPK